MSPLRLAIAGATGRMGRELVRLAAADPTLRLVAAATSTGDPHMGHDAGRVAGIDDLGVPITPDIPADCDVLIEFTLPAGATQWARWCAQRTAALVSGTTGLDDAQLAELRRAAERIPIVHAPNLSLGANLLTGLVRNLAARLGSDWDIEIIETHHRRKLDAPSGTARALLAAAADGRGIAPDAAVFGRQGDVGPRPPGQIGVHAVRMGAIVGEHEVHFTSEHESLTLRHRAFSRTAFAVGALQAAQWICGRAPGLYGMRDVLFT